jgi:hypothetical protein
MSKVTPEKKRKAAPPHMINERRIGRGYRAMGKINLSECENGGADLAEYEKWLKEIPVTENK